MIVVIERNTEGHLIKDLKALWERRPSTRCALLRFSNLKLSREKWLPLLQDTMETYFADDIENIYVCHDDDIFITTRTFTEKQLSLLLTHLKLKLSLASLQGLAALFELKVDWPTLRNMCEKKLETIKILKEKSEYQASPPLESVSCDNTVTGINPDLVSSLSMRREMRDTPVIMVVEDDLFTQKLIKNTLKGNHELLITGDGQGAIMNYVNKAPDILFLDIGLPDIDGHAVLKKIFEIDPAAYIVMFSGNGDRENIMKAIEQGAKGFVGKPFTKDKIFQYVQKSPFIQSKQT